MTTTSLIQLIRNAIAKEWPEAGRLHPESIFERSDGFLMVSLEYGDAAEDLFGEYGASQHGGEFLDNQARLGEVIARAFPRAVCKPYFEMETAGGMYLVQ